MVREQEAGLAFLLSFKFRCQVPSASPGAGCGLGESGRRLGVQMLRVLVTQLGITLRLPSQGTGGAVQWWGMAERGADLVLYLGPPRRCRRAALMT